MKKATKSVVALGLISVAAAIAAPAAMAEQGDWIIRGGATMVDPKDDNLRLGDLVPGAVEDVTLQVDDGTSFGFNVTYMLTDNIGIELLAATPFTHDIDLCATIIDGSGTDSGCGTIGETKHLPPTLSVQYRFMPDSKFQPYVGVGINATLFSDEEFNADGVALLQVFGYSQPRLKLDDSTGFAAQLGADWFFNDRWLINADIRYIEIETDADIVDGDVTDRLGKVEINPIVYSIMIGYKF